MAEPAPYRLQRDSNALVAQDAAGLIEEMAEALAAFLAAIDEEDDGKGFGFSPCIHRAADMARTALAKGTGAAA